MARWFGLWGWGRSGSGRRSRGGVGRWRLGVLFCQPLAGALGCSDAIGGLPLFSR
jgi:hypothetical protein